MGDLKTNWTDPGAPIPGLEGDGVTQRGGEDISQSGDGALQTPWPTDKYATTATPTKETANSVSGLPLQPTRNQPSETPPSPPSLKDRNPGTIDKR